MRLKAANVCRMRSLRAPEFSSTSDCLHSTLQTLKSFASKAPNIHVYTPDHLAGRYAGHTAVAGDARPQLPPASRLASPPPQRHRRRGGGAPRPFAPPEAGAAGATAAARRSAEDSNGTSSRGLSLSPPALHASPWFHSSPSARLPGCVSADTSGTPFHLFNRDLPNSKMHIDCLCRGNTSLFPLICVAVLSRCACTSRHIHGAHL